MLRNEVLNGSLLEAHSKGIIPMSNKKPFSLSSLSKNFPLDQPCQLWAVIQASSHTDPDEQKAVARAIAKDILSTYANRYVSAYYHEVCQLHSGRPFAAYNITALFRDLPKFAKRASKKREKTVLGWVYSFLTKAGEEELLLAFEESIIASLAK